MCDKVAETGCDVRILSPPTILLPLSAFEYFKDIEYQRAGTVITPEIDEDRTKSWGGEWPRDLLQKFKDQIFAAEGHKKMAYEVLWRLGVNAEYIRSDEYLGVGGHVIRSGNIIVIPDYFRHTNVSKTFEELGYEVYFLPVRDYLDGDMEHLDLAFNLTSTQGGNLLATVDTEFQECCREEVESLVKRINARLHVVNRIEERKRKAVNFIELPGGRVIVPSGCPAVQEFLERNLGKENVMVLPLSIE